MKTLQDIRRQLQSGEFEFTRHAFKRAIERNISEQEIREIGENIEIIEDYPEDKFSQFTSARLYSGQSSVAYPSFTD